MDRRGSGFEKIVNGTNRLLNDNNHVDIFSNDVCFSVVIYNANYDDAQNDAQNVAQNDAEKYDIENLIIALIKDNPNITRYEMSSKLGKSIKTIERAIKSSKKIKYIGSSKKGHWEII